MGAADKLLSDTLNAASRQLREEACLDNIDSQVYSEGICVGEHACALDVEADPDNPRWIKLVATSVRGEEIAWDYSSREPNRADARYVFWSRWLGKEEFAAEYPQHRDKMNVLFSTDGESLSVAGNEYFESEFDYSGYNARQPSYVNHKTREVRVVRMEYKVAEKRYFVVSPQTGKHTRVTKQQADMWGSQYEVYATWGDQVYWFEFIENTALFHERAPVPFEGFSIKTFNCYHDTKTNYVYGMVRHMKDPSRDVNKAYTSSIEMLTAQGKPGYIAEIGAVDDQSVFEDSVDAGGSVAWVNDGALQANKITDRKPPVYSEGAARRLDAALQLADRISGVVMDAESPSRAQEAATTVLLREKKSLRSMKSVLGRFHQYQREIAKTICEIIVRSMPDDQIQAYLPNESEVRVQGGVVIDQKRGRQANLRDRAVKYNVELAISSEHQTQKLAQLDLLGALMERGVPIDPEVQLDLAAMSHGTKERLLDYLHQVQQIQGQTQQQQMQQQAAFQQGMLQVEQQKTMQQEMDDRRTALIQREKNMQDALVRLLQVWEKADNDEKMRIEREIDRSVNKDNPTAMAAR